MSLEGRLEDLGLTDIFQIIGLSKRSGILTVIYKAGTGRLVFHEGNVVYATSDRKSRFGYSLLQKGIITYEELEEALKIQKTAKTRKPLGTILVEMGVVGQDIIEKLLKEHILEVVKDLLSWDTGSFHFDLGATLQDDIVLPLGLSAEYLLLEGARLQDEEGRSKNREQTPTAEQAKTVAQAKSETATESEKVMPVALSTSSQKSRKDLTLLTAMIEEISGPSSSSEIILMILRFASEILNRALVFLVRESEVVGLGQFGLMLKNGSADQLIRNVRIPLNEPSCFKGAVANGQSFRGPLDTTAWNEYLVQQLGGHWPLEVLIAPLISDGKVIAILYGDNVPLQKTIENTEGLEAFIRVAGFAFGKAILERKLQATRSKAPGQVD
jgi:hypothetical protein